MAINPIVFVCGQDIRHNQWIDLAQLGAERFGWTVINPRCLPQDLCECSYLPIYITMLEAADALYVIPGADDFECKSLINYASAQGIPILHGMEDLNYERQYYAPYNLQTDLFEEIDCDRHVEAIWNGTGYEWVSKPNK